MRARAAPSCSPTMLGRSSPPASTRAPARAPAARFGLPSTPPRSISSTPRRAASFRGGGRGARASDRPGRRGACSATAEARTEDEAGSRRAARSGRGGRQAPSPRSCRLAAPRSSGAAASTRRRCRRSRRSRSPREHEGRAQPPPGGPRLRRGRLRADHAGRTAGRGTGRRGLASPPATVNGACTTSSSSGSSPASSRAAFVAGASHASARGPGPAANPTRAWPSERRCWSRSGRPPARRRRPT